MEYKASLDTVAKVLTAAVFIIVLGVFGKLYINHVQVTHHIKTLIGVTFIPPILIGCYIYAPKGYTLSDNELFINRIAKNKVIQLADIAEVRPVSPSDFRGTIRTFGNGGFFGYTGKYYNSTLGRMTWYVTQRKNRILITTTNGKKIVISPDDMSLLDELQNRIRK